MNVKNYTFTEHEIYILRDALTEYHQQIKNLKPSSPIAIEQKALALALKEQFKADAVLAYQTINL